MNGTMRNLYSGLKYGALVAWAVFVIAPFLWALSTSFKSDNGVTGGATYIPVLEYEPSLEGWSALFRDTSSGGTRSRPRTTGRRRDREDTSAVSGSRCARHCR